MDSPMESLVKFCIEQRQNFNAAAWMAKFEEEGEAVALAAKYLSMTSWYGHETGLEQFAATTRLFVDNSNGLHREAQALGFDLHYFSVCVRLGLARARQTPRLRRSEPATPAIREDSPS